MPESDGNDSRGDVPECVKLLPLLSQSHSALGPSPPGHLSTGVPSGQPLLPIDKTVSWTVLASASPGRFQTC